MKLILKILFFTIVTNLSYSQETVCDCVEIGIQTFKMIESGTSEEETQKIFEKKNNKCMEIKNKTKIRIQNHQITMTRLQG